MRPVVDRLSNRFSEKVNFVVLNTNDPGAEDVAYKYNVRVVPTILLFNGEGRTVESIAGAQEESVLAEKLSNLR